MKAKMYVLHSPYPDKTWRGIEKCLGNPEYDAIYFFQDIQPQKIIFGGKRFLKDIIPLSN